MEVASSEELSDGTTEAFEQPANPYIAVDYRQIEGRPVKVAYHYHGEDEVAHDLAEQLQECGVIAVTAITENEESRQRISKQYTRFLSSEADPEWVKRLADKFIAKEVTPQLVISHLRGSDKTVEVIGMTKDEIRKRSSFSPDDWRAASKEYTHAIAHLEPVETMRQAGMRLAEGERSYLKTEGEVIAKQLRRLAEETPEDKLIGVAISANLVPMIDEISSPRLPADVPAKLRELTESRYFPLDLGDSERLEDKVDSDILERPIGLALGPRQTGKPLVRKLTRQLDRGQREYLLGVLSDLLADPTESFYSKGTKVIEHFRPVANGLLEQLFFE